MAQYKGASRRHELKASRRRKDTRPLGQKLADFFDGRNGVVAGLLLLPLLALLLLRAPLSGELALLLAWAYARRFVRTDNRAFDFPYRAPVQARVRDGSTSQGMGQGITYLGNDLETGEQIYASNSDLRTHMLLLGTTGSGKTEFLLGLVGNALVQNTGFIYVDGKGDPKLQKEIFRLARYLGREDDLLIINFITSGRDFVEKQHDQVTNNMNIMGNTSSGMLIELIVSLMDDSGASGDMWKGRAISFVAALTRPLTYLRDKGYLNLSPEKYLEYFELNVIEELVWEHKGKYGELFDVIVAPLRAYLVTLPGYHKGKIKKQETKTLEQHGYIVMQLTRIFNDLTFNYGHIFKTKVGAVDFFDVVFNRRLLVVLLPALERAPDSLRMLGKMIVGSIKQMMAGCLGNRVEGVVREIIDSRPTNAAYPFYTILDEYGYYAVLGFAVAPAQARALGFSMIFAAQDFSSLKKSSAEEADSTWENTNIRAVGRITSGQRSETWERIQGASGEALEAELTAFESRPGMASEAFRPQSNIAIERRARLAYDDLAMQENGEFTFLIGKKERQGQSGGVRVIRGMGFYTAGPAPKAMRINDLTPVEPPEPADLPPHRQAVTALRRSLVDGSLPQIISRAIKADPILTGMRQAFERNHHDPERPRLDRVDAALAALGWFVAGGAPIPAATPAAEAPANANADEVSPPRRAPDPPLDLHQLAVEKVLAQVAAAVLTPSAGAAPTNVSASEFPLLETSAPSGESAVPATVQPLTDSAATTNIISASEEGDNRAASVERPLSSRQDDEPSEDVWEDDLSVADRDHLLNLELAASGKPFDSLEDKWALEEKIDQTRAAIARETTYQAPDLAPVDIDTAQATLDELATLCQGLMKRSLKDAPS